ncbi:Insertion element 4 transposase N-terminal, partial [Aeromonas veronii]
DRSFCCVKIRNLLIGFGFFMRIAHALDFLHASNAAQFESLSDLIAPELITTLLAEEDVATLRCRRMPMERLVWAIIGMAIFRHVPMTQLVNQLDILLPGDRPFVAPALSCKLDKNWETRASNACFTRPLRAGTSRPTTPVGRGCNCSPSMA